MARGNLVSTRGGNLCVMYVACSNQDQNFDQQKTAVDCFLPSLVSEIDDNIVDLPIFVAQISS